VPTYQYACTDCEHRFEQVQAFSDASLTDCPVCGGKLRKVYGSVGVVFKGSGFYRTDSRSGAAGPTAGGDKSEAAAAPDSGKAATKESGTTPAKSGDSGSSSGSSSSGSSSSGSSSSGSPSSGGSTGSSSNGSSNGAGKASSGKPAAAAKS
jgi:putative FmdB family regulatory protein